LDKCLTLAYGVYVIRNSAKICLEGG